MAASLQQHRSVLRRATSGPNFYDLTADVALWLRTIGVADGTLTLFIRHTSASLTIQENADPAVLRDLRDSLERLAPEAHPYRHSTEGPDDMPAHIKAMLTALSLTVPVADGAMMLGTWQAIYLIEHRTAPHAREIIAHYIGT